MSPTAELRAQALDWLARLPFLCAYDLSKLLSVGETRAQRILSELEGLGWCEWVATSSRGTGRASPVRADGGGPEPGG